MEPECEEGLGLGELRLGMSLEQARSLLPGATLHSYTQEQDLLEDFGYNIQNHLHLCWALTKFCITP